MASGSGTRRRSPKKPVTAKDKALSKKHLRESIAFNEAHAREHLAAAKTDRAQLRRGAGRH
jgi:hypothetical protein